ncbi:MAG: HAMP domain-containing histidine kinase [Chloroflexi bacterium]|nr:HAMP domain-containing histidine kinase [Chloroflexota bacterium]
MPAAQAGATTADLQAINARQRELDELKDTFVALVSHELRTPANLVNGYLEIGIDQLGPNVPAETRQYFETAKTAAVRLIRIVQELTDFARLQGGKQVELADPIPLGDAILQVFTLLRPALESKSIKPGLDLPRELWTLKYDGESLIIIFRNLLSNAAKFTPVGGRVWVSGEHVPASDLIAIKVNDTAAPIPPEKRMTIFEDFRQLENHLTRRYEGLGLGLAVARRTARVLGGEITLEVRPDGNTFTLALPGNP